MLLFEKDNVSSRGTGSVAFGEFIRGLRLEKGLTVCKLAEMCGIGKEMLIAIETGECQCSGMDVLRNQAFELFTSYPYLLQLAGWLDDREG